MRSLAPFNINEVKSLYTQVNDLLQQAIDKGLDTSEALALIKKADEFLADARELYSSGNYIAANNLALQAIEFICKQLEF